MATSERELLAPTLCLLAKKKHRARGLSVSELNPLLREFMPPDADDVRALKDRTDDHYSQKVRNLVSHKKLMELGYVEYRIGGTARSGMARPGRLRITRAGLAAASRISRSALMHQLELPIF